MIRVYVNGITEDRRALVAYANGHQNVYQFTCEPSADFEVVLSAVQHTQMFHIPNRDKVFVSMWNVEGICLYAQIRKMDYFLLCSLLGLTQLRALTSCTLIPEDFLHSEPKECLFAQHATRPDTAVKLLEPWICPGCLAFYRCLGVEQELETLEQVVQRLAVHAASLRSRSNETASHDALG